MGAALLAGCGGSSGSPPTAELIQAFSASAGAVTLGDGVSFSWTIASGGATGSCALDVDGDGAIDYSFANCAGVVQEHRYENGGLYRAELQLLDSAGFVLETKSVDLTVSGPQVRIVAPVRGATVGASLAVSAEVTSGAPIAAVTASAGVVATDLAPAAAAGTWTGTLPLDALAQGPVELVVRARPQAGVDAVARVPMTFDRPPRLEIVQPAPASVARPTVALDLVCTDDGGGPCEIEVYFAGLRQTSPPIATGQQRLVTTLDLRGRTGVVVDFEIVARDAGDNEVTTTLRTFVEPSISLRPVVTVDGLIRDTTDAGVLFQRGRSSPQGLAVLDRATGATRELPVPTGATVDPEIAFLTPTGAVYVARDAGGTAVLFEAGDELIELGRPNHPQSPRWTRGGQFLIWNENRRLWLRQVVTRQTVEVSRRSGNRSNEVTTLGDVVYWNRDFQLFRFSTQFRKGITATTQLTAPSVSWWNQFPRADGAEVVYRKTTPCCADEQRAIARRRRGGGEEILADFGGEGVDVDRDYQTAGGWIAFTRPRPGGGRDVWRRTPDGLEQQLTISGAGVIDALAPNGDVMVLEGRSRVLYAVSGTFSVVGSALGESVFLGGAWFVQIGNTLFAVA